MTTKERNYLKLLDALITEESLTRSEDKITEEFDVVFARFILRRIIIGTLNLISRESISAYIDWLLAKGCILPNPTSEYMSGKFMPHNATKYIIDIFMIKFIRDQLSAKLTSTHSPSLDHYTSKQPVGAMVQKEETDNLK